MRRVAFGLLWVALAAEGAWVALDRFFIHQRPGLDLLGAGVAAFFVVFAALGRRWRWLALGARWVMALEFLLAVADRFGLLGPPGAPDVSWGDFAHFVAYTRQVNAFLPAGLAPVLAVLATVAELTLGMALAVGFRTRLTALGAAALLLCYGVAMTISLPPAQQFHYVVFILCTGMFALATVDASLLSLDALSRPFPGRGGTNRLS